MNKILLLAFCFFLIGYAHAGNDRAFFWRINLAQDSTTQAVSANTTVYLLGSIHFADKSFYPLRKELETAFSQSDSLVVELDISKVDRQAYDQQISKTGVYSDGTDIKDVISEETWLQLKRRLQYLNIPFDAVRFYKPGVLVLSLTAIQVMKMGFDPELGIDAYFLSKALRQNHSGSGKVKQVIELETLEQQLGLFINMPNGELLLKESLYSLADAETQMSDMVRLWKQGDEKAMNKLLFEDGLKDYPAFADIYEQLFYQRNRQMSNKIEQMLKTGGSYFVVVGSGHLIGEKGIVNALKQKGYQVKRL